MSNHDHHPTSINNGASCLPPTMPREDELLMTPVGWGETIIIFALLLTMNGMLYWFAPKLFFASAAASLLFALWAVRTYRRLLAQDRKDRESHPLHEERLPRA